MEADAPTQRLVLIRYADLPAIWSQIGPLMEEACSWSYGAFTPESVVASVREGRFTLIGMEEDGRVASVMVTTVGELSSGLKIFECLLVAGRDMKSWLPFEKEMDAFAKVQGCARVRAIGRKSLTKVLPHWKMIGVMLEREIE